jgi:hypothetical protein
VKKLNYKSGYKYQVHDDFSVQTKILVRSNISTTFVDLATDGTLTVKAGYAWDGCSGPTLDTKSTMRAGCVHDALYGLTRADLLSQVRREAIDKEFHRILLEDGAWRFRAWYYYQAVRKFGLSASSAENRKKVHTAP